MDFITNIIDEYIKYRVSLNCWNENATKHLRAFKKYCLENYPNINILTQEMVDTWCIKRKTEINNSCNKRIMVISGLLKYTNSRNITNLTIPSKLKPNKITYIPHAFTEQELKNFFYACDNINTKINNTTSKNLKLSIPVFFRLLYSTGMRPLEARLLKVSDVNLENGVINITKSKGLNQHYVVLDDLMKEHMIKYNEQISELYPNRTYFFPSVRNSYHQKEWVIDNFQKYWRLYNKSYARPYDLRHNYAITNINNWINDNVEFISKFDYLSKSMGHTVIESTKYYYSIIPKLSSIFYNQINNTFDNIAPEVRDYE